MLEIDQCSVCVSRDYNFSTSWHNEWCCKDCRYLEWRMIHPHGYRWRLAFPYFSRVIYTHTQTWWKETRISGRMTSRRSTSLVLTKNKLGHGHTHSCEAPHPIKKYTTISTTDKLKKNVNYLKYSSIFILYFLFSDVLVFSILCYVLLLFIDFNSISA